MAMRTVGGPGRASSPSRSASASGVDAPARPEQHHPNAKHATGTATRARPRTAPVPSASAEPTGPASVGPQPEGEDGPEHEQAHRQHVGPVPGQLPPGGVTPPARAPGSAGAAWSSPRWSCRAAGLRAGFFSSGPTRDHAASWSRASLKGNTRTTTHNSICPPDPTRLPHTAKSGHFGGAGPPPGLDPLRQGWQPLFRIRCTPAPGVAADAYSPSSVSTDAVRLSGRDCITVSAAAGPGRGRRIASAAGSQRDERAGQGWRARGRGQSTQPQ